MARKQDIAGMILTTILILGFMLTFFSYQTFTSFQAELVTYNPRLAIAYVIKPGVSKDKPQAKPAKYAIFKAEHSIRRHFLPLNKHPADTETFEIPFNITADDSSQVTVQKYGNYIKVLENVEVDKINVDCVDLKIKRNITKICVYKRENDLFVSGSIRNNGNWEERNLGGLEKALRGKPDMVFLDIGCNIGIFTTYAMLFGNPTVCIDPLLANLQVMMKTLQLTKDDKNVILLWNAVSEKHEKVTLFQGQDHNIGSNHVQKLNETKNIKKVVNYEVQTIILDDFQHIFADKRIFIKLDIENYEWKALEGGENFFKKANICYVLMEIVTHKIRDTGLKICNFLSSFGLYPFADIDMKYSLNVTMIESWPVDVIFIKNTTECQIK